MPCPSLTLQGLIPTSIPPHKLWWRKIPLVHLSFHHVGKCPEDLKWAVKDVGFHSCFVKKRECTCDSMNLPARIPSIPLCLSWIRTEGNKKRGCGGMEDTRIGTALFSAGSWTCWKVEKPSATPSQYSWQCDYNATHRCSCSWTGASLLPIGYKSLLRARFPPWSNVCLLFHTKLQREGLSRIIIPEYS